MSRLNRLLDEGLGPVWGAVVFGALLLLIGGCVAALLYYAVPDLGID